jgi:hypothetical protein
MSKIGDCVLDLQEIVQPLVYTGHSDESIIEEVNKFLPETPESWIVEEIKRARFGQSYY